MLLTMGMHGKESPITIVGPVGIRHTVLTVLAAQGGFYSYKIYFIELEGERSIYLGNLMDGVTVSAHFLQHRLPSYGYIIREPTKPGALDGKLARELGATGPQLRELKEKRNVTLLDGTIIPYHR